MYMAARVKKITDVRTIHILVTCRAWFGASLSSRRMFSLFVELILKLSFAVSPLSALELMYRCHKFV